ncbi:MAG: hypothetical protein KDC54_10395 [Lewinella sp.]|nr:hypothetical protein [Lewinella sp.]
MKKPPFKLDHFGGYFSLVVFLFLVVGCQKEAPKVPGCTDPDALNYEVGTNEDDGTCTYERDKFLGEYTNTSYSCIDQQIWQDNEPMEFRISKVPGEPSMVTFVTIYTRAPIDPDLRYNGVVNGNTIEFDYSYSVPGFYIDAHTYVGAIAGLKGTATLTGNEFDFPDARFTVSDADGNLLATFACHLTGTKVE